jgi:hypothetical protein
MAHAQNSGVVKKRSVFLRVWEPDEYDPEDDGVTHYHARVGRTLEIEGTIYYAADREDVKSLVSRILKAEDPIPESALKAVDAVVNYLITVVQLGSTAAAASAGFDRNGREGLTFTTEVFYGDDGSWHIQVRAVNATGSGRHILTKRAALGRVDAEALRKIIVSLVRRAHNARL